MSAELLKSNVKHLFEVPLGSEIREPLERMICEISSYDLQKIHEHFNYFGSIVWSESEMDLILRFYFSHLEGLGNPFDVLEAYSMGLYLNDGQGNWYDLNELSEDCAEWYEN